ncbi:hypothetical protein SAMN06295885_2004 [Rathayibacter oskolensis]|uniref:Uncharacterized protein n=1 Tax=Rathayibacter oskolensis TaxID=1891671 RepID=A0A1X7NW97_9MICO|nr:hypothetical protein [Rathayibacter oskolensis]SMH42516.1 hypothetical protein SAMN06295885_2004 [Rathayibacter oskolensis]
MSATALVRPPILDSSNEASAPGAEPSHRPRRGARRAVLLALLSLLVTSAVAFGGAGAAQAYSFPTPVGPVGGIAVGTTYINKSPVGPGGPKTIYGPPVSVTRSASVRANTLQKVIITWQVQTWENGRWVNYATDSRSSEVWLQAGQTQVTAYPGLMGNFSGNYYRVAGTVEWYDSSSFTMTGYRHFLPTAASENVCTVSNCIAYNGYVWFG